MVVNVIRVPRRGRQARLLISEDLNDFVALHANGGDAPAHLGRGQHQGGVEDDVVIVHGEAPGIPGVNHLGHVEPEQLHETLHGQMFRSNPRRVDADLPIRRRTHGAHHFKGDSRALPERARLFDLAAFPAELQVLERCVWLVEDVGVHGIGHARQADADFG